MANGSGRHIQWPSVRLDCRLRNVSFEADFLVCHILDDTILEKEFLRQQDCSVACNQGLLIKAGKALYCTDRVDRLLAIKLQVNQTLTLPSSQEIQVSYRWNSNPSGPVSCIESSLTKNKGMAVAATLN